MSDCCNSFGGRITLEGGGKRFAIRGEVTINPTDREVSAEAHHDGSAYFVEKPQLYTVAFEFSDPCDRETWDVLKRCAVNVTAEQESGGRVTIHTWTGGRFVGRPSVNISTGQVSGTSYASDRYRATGG
jgi:hypothetical protein